MPIIIHRGPDPQSLNAANDWDKAAGLLAMIVVAVIALQDLVIGGLLFAIVNWEPVQRAAKPGELVELRTIAALFVVHTVMMGLMNLVVAWGIWAKARWAFAVGPFLNIAALLAMFIWLEQFELEFVALGILMTGYCMVRLAGILGPKP